MTKSKYASLTADIKSLMKQGLNNKSIVNVLIKKYPEKKIGFSNGTTEVGKITKRLKNEVHNEVKEDKSATHTNQYGTGKFRLSAMKANGKVMQLKEFCDTYGLNYKDYRSAKICTHHGDATYNLASKVFEEKIEVISIDDFRKKLKALVLSEKTKFNVYKAKPLRDQEVAIKLADLHFGAMIEGLMKTKDFNSTILKEMLEETAQIINSFGFKTVHIHILGDLIESFTGLNHINAFKSLNTAEIGAEAIKGCTILLHNFLNKINNLGEIKIIAGNHDRITSNNKEDVKGDAANLIAWALELLGYSVEFNSVVIKHTFDGICHILTHGHHGISRLSTKELCFDYGEQGLYNLICEGHLHSIIEKLTPNQRKVYKTIKDDAVDHRRMNCPSFFTGNYFSETLGYTSTGGFVITFNNGKGTPHVWYMAV
jgi:hypothetical protein